MADDYTTSALTSQNSLEQSKFNKQTNNEIADLHTKIRNVQQNYLKKSAFEEQMSFYATNETIEEMKLQMKGMPTLSGMDLRFKTMTDEMDAF